MNTKLEMWLTDVNIKRKKYWDKEFSYKPYTPLTYKKGRKFVKIIDEGSVWGFVSMEQMVHKGSLVCVGDLLKAEGWNSPAKHSRGNIFDGSAKYSYYGPEYLK
jgi:hypothetical protein